MFLASSKRSHASSSSVSASSSSYACILGASKRTSLGRTASAPCTMKNGVNCVDAFGVVRRLQSTDGSSSGQAPAARLSGTRRRFLIPLVTKPLAFSTCPFDYGCATEA